MIKIFWLLSFIFSITVIFSCNNSRLTTNNNQYITLKNDDKLTIYIKSYFVLSESRKLETWYNIYLSKCTTFYKIENPTKDSILNLIKSYWITSNAQNHDITKIEAKKTANGKEILITMNYSYNIIATNTQKVINNLKLLMILDKKRKVILVKEFSRG